MLKLTAGGGDVRRKFAKRLIVLEATFFFENRIRLWEVLLLIFNFAFEFLNVTTRQLVGVSLSTITVYKKCLRIILLTMFDKRNIKLGGEGRIVEIDESLFIRVKHNRGQAMRRPKVWVFCLVSMKEPLLINLNNQSVFFFIKLNREMR
jgi:hypothetical protein